MPSESEKKACPRASSMTLLLTFEKSGCSRNRTPSEAPGSIHDATTMTTRSSSRSGIRIFAARSMPPFTPRTTTRWVSTTKATAQRQGFKGSVENVWK